MILTDGDLFPPGTIQLNGVKVFGEDLSRVSSYAASMARAADCGLQRLFDGLLRSEGGHYEKVDDFSFYEEGGYSATIRGESVLLGTASFMRKMEVRLPGGINLRTGIFLAMDRQLAAVFAVKYQPSENVDFALADDAPQPHHADPGVPGSQHYPGPAEAEVSQGREGGVPQSDGPGGFQ